MDSLLHPRFESHQARSNARVLPYLSAHSLYSLINTHTAAEHERSPEPENSRMNLQHNQTANRNKILPDRNHKLSPAHMCGCFPSPEGQLLSKLFPPCMCTPKLQPCVNRAAACARHTIRRPHRNCCKHTCHVPLPSLAPPSTQLT